MVKRTRVDATVSARLRSSCGALPAPPWPAMHSCLKNLAMADCKAPCNGGVKVAGVGNGGAMLLGKQWPIARHLVMAVSR